MTSIATDPKGWVRAARWRSWHAVILTATLAIAVPRPSLAAAAPPRTFPSAAAAATALYDAVRSGDQNAVHAVLGADEKLSSCGDASMDRSDHDRFVTKYQEMHRLVREPDGTTVLYIGAENWPFPIPLVGGGRAWRFDVAAGRRELLFRRIGANEAIAIEIARAAVEMAKRGATAIDGSDPIQSYAARLAAAARADGTVRDAGSDTPFHGYRFVRREGGAAGIVAYPAEYRSSGVMTFVVGDDGIVYARDLGPETDRLARTLKTRPAGWRAVG